jgi:hypothetical protein
MAIKLGSKVRDNITGFEGIAIARTEWLHSCARVTIQPTALHDGKPVESHTFDEKQVEIVEERAPVVESHALDDDRTGGPQDDPVSRRSPVARQNPERGR